MSRRILVIEDDEQMRLLLKNLLENNGYIVEEASDGRAGIRTYMAEPHDLVITDLIMPEQEGLETILILRQYNADIKIIAISGGGTIPSKHYLRMAECFGAQRTFAKPFRVNEVLSAVTELLQ